MWQNPNFGFFNRRRRGRPRGRAYFYNRNHIAGRRRRMVGFHQRKKRVSKRPNQGYQNLQVPMRVSAPLAGIINTNVATRAQIVRGVWAYIKEHDLQTAYNGRVIVPDRTLATVIGKEGIPMNAFTMMKYIKNHISVDKPKAATVETAPLETESGSGQGQDKASKPGEENAGGANGQNASTVDGVGEALDEEVVDKAN